MKTNYIKEFMIIILVMLSFVILGTILILIDELVLKSDRVLIGIGSSLITMGISNTVYKLFFDIKNNKNSNSQNIPFKKTFPINPNFDKYNK